MKYITVFLGLLLISPIASAQDLKEKYKRADNFNESYGALYYYGISQIEAIDSTHCFWYRTKTPSGIEFILVDADENRKSPAFDHTKLATALESFLGEPVEAGKLPFSTIRFDKNLKSIRFRVKEDSYTCDLNTYTVQKTKPAFTPRNREQYWGHVFQEDRKVPVKSPNGKWEAYIVDGNLWVKSLKSNKTKTLSNDGSPYEYYASSIFWSPDSKKIVCCKYRPAGVRQLHLIESSPADQLQPKLNTVDYVKPGDALPIRRPVWFDVETGTQQTVNVPDLESQFSLEKIEWNDHSSQFYFSVNRRGHQEYFIYGVEIPSGKTTTIVHETSPTFIYYNALYRYHLKESKELLWISERDGWRHLYLYDISTGQVKRQLTKGEWVLKSVTHVDEKNRTLIFKACGMDKDEDPYLEKYYTLQVNSGKIIPLTPENANHRVIFSQDYAYMIDDYSRVDLPPATVLRSVSDGKTLIELEKADISELIKAGWQMPEVFSAKGRDGKTDIWGVIIRPTDFDPNKKYPVIEYIYAGPHDSHVPKSFAVTHHCSGLAELGFITVLIDGMGTANRSKVFHDVCWKNLKDAGFPDRIAWIKAAALQYPEMDIERVGIYGSSAGGQNSTAALLFHPDFYKVGVSSCGCHDNRMDKIWWNEQWMGYPIGKQYEESSNTCNAHLLQGKLMLILGELDDNVDPSTTLQLVNALVKHNKEFEFVMLPGAKHTGGGVYGERKRKDFFVKHLLELETPEWNEGNHISLR
jgi:dipeptidyl aminopeptidase/acylaminoacyl peptidase